MTRIGNNAFFGCSGLESAVWNAENCTTAGSFAFPIFEGCTNLKTVTLGEAVRAIPAYAFEGCGGLESVYYKGTPSEWGGIEIDDGNGDLTKAARYYFSAQAPSAEQWEESPNWWHYAEDGAAIVLWTKEQA